MVFLYCECNVIAILPDYKNPTTYWRVRKKRLSDLGYESETSVYQAQNCTGCPLRNRCYKAQENRRIELNHRLLQYKKKARELLMSEKGLRHRSKRPVEVEAVFGQLKKNKGFNRFRLRGLKKVEVEFGLLAMAYNFMKLMKNREKTCFRRFIFEIMACWERELRKRIKIEKSTQKNIKKYRPKILLFDRPLI